MKPDETEKISQCVRGVCVPRSGLGSPSGDVS